MISNLFTRTTLTILPLAAALGGLTTLAAKAQMIVDGDFETPAVSIPNLEGVGYYNYDVGSTFGGPNNNAWKVVMKGTQGGNVSLANTTEYHILDGQKIYYNAYDGGQYLDLTGDTDNGSELGVEQTVATTIGTEYTLSFFIGNSMSNPMKVGLFINDTDIASYENNGAPLFTPFNGDGVKGDSWLKVTYNFVASSNSTTLGFYNQTQARTLIGGIDDVSLQVFSLTDIVPEPSTWGMLFLGLGALAVMAYRKRMKPQAAMSLLS